MAVSFLVLVEMHHRILGLDSFDIALTLISALLPNLAVDLVRLRHRSTHHLLLLLCRVECHIILGNAPWAVGQVI